MAILVYQTCPKYFNTHTHTQWERREGFKESNNGVYPKWLNSWIHSTNSWIHCTGFKPL